jgi:hypothetical protein
MTIENLTLKEIRELQSMFNQSNEKPHPFKVGQAYFIRTVTMIIVGKLEKVFDNELLLSDASWIADTGRFSDCLKKGESVINEIEPFHDEVIIGRNSIIDATIWSHNLPKNQK